MSNTSRFLRRTVTLCGAFASACALFESNDDPPDDGDTASSGQGGESAVDPCSLPTKATIDVAGGQLTHCGATLVVPPGALAGPMTIKIVAVPPPAAPPGHALISHAFEIESGLPIASWSSLTIAYPPAQGTVMLARFDEESEVMRAVEACEITGATVQQFLPPTAESAVGTYELGTWGVIAASPDVAVEPPLGCGG
jgi:hypothetical protein